MWSASHATDPDNGGSSLLNAAEVVIPCLEASGATSVIEVGAGSGGLTRELLDWAAGHGATVTAIDPSPTDGLLELAGHEPELELVQKTSHEALPELPQADAFVLDGDHNYYTLSRELELISERAGAEPLPLLVLHDVGWPHARRDTYYAPDRIPEEHRQVYAENVSLDPAVSGIAPGGIPFRWAALKEGGPGNGILTAIEDFIEGRDELEFAKVPVFWGVGVIWDRRAPGADALATTIAPWRENTLLQRLEEHRISHLVELCQTMRELSDLEGVNAQQQALLRRMLDSSAFAWAERLSRLKQRGNPMFTREQVQVALGEIPPPPPPPAAEGRTPGAERLSPPIPRSATGEAS